MSYTLVVLEVSKKQASKQKRCALSSSLKAIFSKDGELIQHTAMLIQHFYVCGSISAL